MGNYSDNPAWADVTPIPLNDGTDHYVDGNANGEPAHPLATIAYTDEYLEATSYLRAVMAANEMSERALALTTDIIALNPAHYTVWLYRVETLVALKKDLNEELAWVNKVALAYLKNYQIWHHRQIVVSKRETFPALPAGEQDFLMKMFAQDSKNYHVWTYRHWLVRHFALWDSARELADTEQLIDEDVRNNSAWNHRWVLRFGPRGEVDSGMPTAAADAAAAGAGAEQIGTLPVVDEDLIDAELQYAKAKVLQAPENRCPWSYMRGVLRAAGRPMAELAPFAQKFITEEVDESGRPLGTNVTVRSSMALEWLADVYAAEVATDGEEKATKGPEAIRMLTLLKEKYDPIRMNYWEYRIQMLKTSGADEQAA